MKNSLRALLVDDETTARITLSRILKMYCPEVEIVGEAGNIIDAGKLIQQLEPEIVFLDIRIGQHTGFDLLEMIKRPNFQLVFVTAYDQYALQAFEYSALDYLLKPIDPDRLIYVVQKSIKERNNHQLSGRLQAMRNDWDKNEPETIVVNNDQGYHFIPLSGLMRLSSDRGTTAFHSEDQPVITVAKNIGEFAKMLPDSSFFRCHQSHVINLRWVSSYLFQDGGTIIMRDKTPIPLARARREDFIKRIKNF
ncbi:LytR/AlgR family response regulator transcription factor [Lewinella cohaerens]|uniref:LytR/AlgR family response regulator transcription factor n=1 Tax=Lewinella cohaerens TaxID=70995 RepID=UPI00036667C2|nr:LytTR family DNA-binding domain-containing protein [Lewinella cohaerens]